VPLTLLQASGEHRAVVVEMGMRGLGEIERLSRCCEPDLAVITNVGTAHIGRLGSREAIAQAKCEITAALKPDGLVVIPAGDPLLDRTLAAGWGGRVLRVALAGEGFEDQADWVGQLDLSSGSLAVRGAVLPLPLAGAHNARNLPLALAGGRQPGDGPRSPSGPWRWICPEVAAGAGAWAPLSCSMRPTTPRRRPPWRPWSCWRPALPAPAATRPRPTAMTVASGLGP
jgi:hypothetical protein